MQVYNLHLYFFFFGNNMKKITFIILIAVLISSVVYFTGEKALEKSPVMEINLSIAGDFDNPVFDVNNTTRVVEMVPIIKQNEKSNLISANSIVCDVFYSQQKIGNAVVVPYSGPGSYPLTFMFKDDVRLPTSNQESVTVQFMFLNENEVFATKYLSVFWINSTEL